MADVMELIQAERKRLDISAEKFANMVGVTSTTFSRQINSRQGLGIESLHAYAKYAKQTGNVTLLRALGAYALAMELDEIIINPSK